MTEHKTPPVSLGLEGIVVAETELSRIDGQQGTLILRGRAVEDFAGHYPFEQGMHWLHTGQFLDPPELTQLQANLAAARVRTFEQRTQWQPVLSLGHPMDALRAAVAQIDSDVHSDLSLDILATLSVVSTAWARTQNHQPLVPPSPGLRHAEDFLQMLHGSPGSAAATAALDAYWLTVIDHGLNASTFAARVVASTDSDPVSAVTAALGALKGRLHGGAPGPVLDMLDEIGTEAEARPWLIGQLERRARIMGMGHRVYRVRDPRAAVLEKAVQTLHTAETPHPRVALAQAVERHAEDLLAERHPDRPLRANVEFYTAILLEALGLPRTLFTPAFAVSRAAGWLAHIDEQHRTGRLIRPASRYIGPDVM